VSGRGNYARIYAVVRRIPKGRVTTYGNVARIAGLAGHARQVGYALSALPAGTTVPWHRVINAQGKLSLEREGRSSGTTQRILLVREGVIVNARRARVARALRLAHREANLTLAQ
jgi:methylated-DNA-protein-cysteine methyltransferase-like protein